MPGKRYTCTLTDSSYLCPTTVQLKFEPKRTFTYEPGQFVSLVVPGSEDHSYSKRLYSLASSPNRAKEEGYELCIKLHDGGVGSEYVKELQKGQQFEIFAPYGDFVYEPPRAERSVCFIANGTGVAPVRSILQSKKFEKHRPDHVECILGFRDQSEVLYANEWEQFGIDLKIILKQRITEYFADKKTPLNDVADTEFYLVGSPSLVSTMTDFLRRLGVSDTAIHKELFSGKK